MQEEYFEIELSMLPPHAIIFSFGLFVTDPKRQRYLPFLGGNQPLVPEKKSQLEKFLGAGLILCVKKSQMKTFLEYCELKKEDIPSLNPKETVVQVDPHAEYRRRKEKENAPPTEEELRRMEEEKAALRLQASQLNNKRDDSLKDLKKSLGIEDDEDGEMDVEAEILLANMGEDTSSDSEDDFDHEKEERLKKIKEKRKIREHLEGNFDLMGSFTNALMNNDFTPLIEQMAKEVSVFEYTVSPTTSLAIYLCEQLLNEDNRLNRVVVVTYFLAKINKMNNEEDLGNLIVASLLHKIGMTQIDTFFSFKPTMKLNDRERKLLRKYPGFASHLMRKSKLEVSDECKNIIAEHQERYNGTGFPFQKKAEYIEPGALILGLASHIVDYSEGLVTGESKSLYDVVSCVISQSNLDGLDLNFGYALCSSLGGLLAKKAAADEAKEEAEAAAEAETEANQDVSSEGMAA